MIDFVTRKCCTKCRLDKCFAIGMKKELICSKMENRQEQLLLLQKQHYQPIIMPTSTTAFIKTSITTIVTQSQSKINNHLLYLRRTNSSSSSSSLSSSTSTSSASASLPSPSSPSSLSSFNIAEATSESSKSLRSLSFEDQNFPNIDRILDHDIRDKILFLQQQEPITTTINDSVDVDSHQQKMFIKHNNNNSIELDYNNNKYNGFIYGGKEEMMEIENEHRYNMEFELVEHKLEFGKGRRKKENNICKQQYLAATTTNTIELAANEQILIEEIVSASKCAEFYDENHFKIVGEVTDLIYALNLGELYIKKTIKFCKSISMFRGLNQQDQLVMLKDFFTEMMIVRFGYVYDPVRDALPVIEVNIFIFI